MNIHEFISLHNRISCFAKPPCFLFVLQFKLSWVLLLYSNQCMRIRKEAQILVGSRTTLYYKFYYALLRLNNVSKNIYEFISMHNRVSVALQNLLAFCLYSSSSSFGCSSSQIAATSPGLTSSPSSAATQTRS